MSCRDPGKGAPKPRCRHCCGADRTPAVGHGEAGGRGTSSPERQKPAAEGTPASKACPSFLFHTSLGLVTSPDPPALSLRLQAFLQEREPSQQVPALVAPCRAKLLQSRARACCTSTCTPSPALSCSPDPSLQPWKHPVLCPMRASSEEREQESWL